MALIGGKPARDRALSKDIKAIGQAARRFGEEKEFQKKEA
jgi:hypothetical protein